MEVVMNKSQNSKLMQWLKGAASDWQLYMMLLPTLVYVFIFSYIPMYGILISFKNYRPNLGVWGSPWVGLDHFIRFIRYPAFWKIFTNTLTLSLYSFAMFPLPIILALLVNEIDSPFFRKTVQMITYAPHFISTVVLCGIVMLFFQRSNGLINNLIVMLGGQRVDFLTRPEYFPHLYVWSGVWQTIGWSTIIYFAALSSVSPELIEAARIDGASRMQIMLHVNIPTILPTIVIMLILRCGSILSVGFEKVYLLKNDLNSDKSQVISTYVYEIGLLGGQFSYSTAIGMFNTVINVICILTVNAIAKKVSEISLW